MSTDTGHLADSDCVPDTGRTPEATGGRTKSVLTLDADDVGVDFGGSTRLLFSAALFTAIEREKNHRKGYINQVENENIQRNGRSMFA